MLRIDDILAKTRYTLAFADDIHAFGVMKATSRQSRGEEAIGGDYATGAEWRKSHDKKSGLFGIPFGIPFFLSLESPPSL